MKTFYSGFIVALCFIDYTFASESSCKSSDSSEESEERKKLNAELEDMEKNLPTMDYNNKEHFEERRKKREVKIEKMDTIKNNKEELTNKILKDMIVDDQYIKDMNELQNKVQEKAHIKNYLYKNFEEQDWLKRYKRELLDAFEDIKVKINEENVFDGFHIKNKNIKRSKRDLGDHEKDKETFTKQLANFEINQANIKSMIDKGIALNMQKAMKISIDYALKSYVNTSSSLDESVQRFFLMKQEYMNLIDKWYHGVVIDLPNYLKTQERKKINLSFDDDQPTEAERVQLNALSDYEKKVDTEFAEVGIHYGKLLLNNYCDLDDLFYKFHRENNKCDIKHVFSENNTNELLKKEKIM